MGSPAVTPQSALGECGTGGMGHRPLSMGKRTRVAQSGSHRQCQMPFLSLVDFYSSIKPYYKTWETSALNTDLLSLCQFLTCCIYRVVPYRLFGGGARGGVAAHGGDGQHRLLSTPQQHRERSVEQEASVCRFLLPHETVSGPSSPPPVPPGAAPGTAAEAAAGRGCAAPRPQRRSPTRVLPGSGRDLPSPLGATKLLVCCGYGAQQKRIPTSVKPRGESPHPARTSRPGGTAESGEQRG